MFKVNEKVDYWRPYDAQEPSRAQKLIRNWSGPFIVVKHNVNRPHQVVIKDPVEGWIKRVFINHIRHHRPRKDTAISRQQKRKLGEVPKDVPQEDDVDDGQNQEWDDEFDDDEFDDEPPTRTGLIHAGYVDVPARDLIPTAPEEDEDELFYDLPALEDAVDMTIQEDFEEEEEQVIDTPMAEVRVSKRALTSPEDNPRFKRTQAITESDLDSDAWSE